MPDISTLTGRYAWVAPQSNGWIPDGWIAIFEGMLGEVDALFASEPEQTLADFVGVKEKLGTLRIRCVVLPEGSAPGLQLRVREIVAAAEIRSAGVCDVCGRPGSLRESTSGWYATRCDDHISD